MSRQQRVKRKRREVRRARLFERSFHSEERVLFIKSLPCEVTGRLSDTVVNAHTKSRGAGGTYKDIVPLSFRGHRDYDELGEEDFEARYGRTKYKLATLAEHYYQPMWEEHKND